MNLCTFSSEYGPVFILAQPIQLSNQKSWKTGLPVCLAFSIADPKSLSHWIPAIVFLLAPDVHSVSPRRMRTRTCFLPVPGARGGPGPLARGGVPSATLATLRPLAAGSARRDFFLAPQAASSTPPHRLGAPVASTLAMGRAMGGAAAEGGSARSFPGGRASAASRAHRKSSDFAKEPPPRMRSDRPPRAPGTGTGNTPGNPPATSPD